MRGSDRERERDKREKQARRKSPNAALMKEHCVPSAVKSNFLNPTGANCARERETCGIPQYRVWVPHVWHVRMGVQITSSFSSFPLLLLLIPASRLLPFSSFNITTSSSHPPNPTPSPPPPPSIVTRSLHVSPLSLSPSPSLSPSLSLPSAQCRVKTLSYRCLNPNLTPDLNPA